MYYAPGEHNPPHFHVVYAEYECSVSLETLEITEGFLPTRQYRFVAAWAEIHKEDLLADWSLVMNGEKPFTIEPLR